MTERRLILFVLCAMLLLNVAVLIIALRLLDGDAGDEAVVGEEGRGRGS
jgi:hypothetical protein